MALGKSKRERQGESREADSERERTGGVRHSEGEERERGKAGERRPPRDTPPAARERQEGAEARLPGPGPPSAPGHASDQLTAPDDRDPGACPPVQRLLSSRCAWESPGASLEPQRLGHPAPSAGGLGSIPGQGTRAHGLKPRVSTPQLKKLLHAAAKTRCSQMNTKKALGGVP